VVWASLKYGALGAAYAHFVAALVGLLGIVMVFTRVTGLPNFELLKIVWRPFAGASLMGAVVKGTQVMIESSWPSVPVGVQLPSLVALGGVTYILLMLCIWRMAGRPVGAEAAVLSIAREKFFRT
jgi:uncharacterized membrane protein YjfL (UPF0719 family)